MPYFSFSMREIMDVFQHQIIKLWSLLDRWSQIKLETTIHKGHKESPMKWTRWVKKRAFCVDMFYLILKFILNIRHNNSNNSSTNNNSSSNNNSNNHIFKLWMGCLQNPQSWHLQLEIKETWLGLVLMSVNQPICCHNLRLSLLKQTLHLCNLVAPCNQCRL